MSEFKGHPRRLTLRLEEIVDFVRFPWVAVAIGVEIADNVINGSLLDTLVRKLKLKWCYIINTIVRLK